MSNMERARERDWESVHATERNEVKWDEQIVAVTAATVPHTTTAALIFPAFMTVDLENIRRGYSGGSVY